MNYHRAQQIVSKFASLRIVTLGDLMIDEFIWGEVRRISPEAPVPVVEAKRETWQLGGAGNGVWNLLELGAQGMAVGGVGNDDSAKHLRARLIERQSDTEGIVTDASRPTTRKTRIVAHSQQMVRADREDRTPISSDIEDRIVATFAQALSKADAVIISDYEKGLLTASLLRRVIESTKSQQKTICLDPKIRNFAHYRGVDVITPNQIEAERASGVEITDEASLVLAARRIRDLIHCKNVLITRGEHGMSMLDEQGEITHIPTVAREVYDVTGAGDTVIATLTLALASGARLNEAA